MVPICFPLSFHLLWHMLSFSLIYKLRYFLGMSLIKILLLDVQEAQVCNHTNKLSVIREFFQII